MLKDIRRLISFRDVLYYAGDQLYRRSLRYTGLTAAVSLLGYLGNFVPGVDTYNAKVAIALPLIVGAATLASGLLLKTIPAFLAGRAMNVAEAQDLDLMEDYRKWHEKRHLAALWQRVYRFEWAVGSAASRVVEHPLEAPPDVCLIDSATDAPGQATGAEANDGCGESSGSSAMPFVPQDVPPDLETLGRKQFFARARFALARPQPQPRQRYYLGIDLRFFEDWRNGAFFDRRDVKLIEQFDASATLQAIKSEIGYDHWQIVNDVGLKWYQKFWLVMIARAVGIHVGEAITQLNRRFQTDYFNAQVLLWPGEDREPWIEQFPRAGEEVRQRRRMIVTRVFGSDAATAQRMLRRMLWPSCWLAAKVRAAYDPEYADGSLGRDVVSDLEEIELAPERIAPYRGLAQEAQADRAALVAWLERFRPELLTPRYAEGFRAARIAVHVARDRLRPFLHTNAQEAKAAGDFVERVLDLVDQAVRRKDRYSARLVGIRMHHEITRLHYQEYLDLLDRLRDSG